MENNQNNQNQGGDNQNNQQEQNDKITKNYNAAIEKLAKVLGGEENLAAPKKIGHDALAKVTNTLLKDRREKAVKEVETDLAIILDKKLALDKEIKQKQDEFEKLKQQKMKEFTEAVNKVFAKVENIDKLGDDYLNILKGVGGEAKADK